MEELLKEINEYLESKIPEVEKSTRDEITAFLVYRFTIHEADTVKNVNSEWKRMLLNRRADRLRKDIAQTSIYPTNWKGENNEP